MLRYLATTIPAVYRARRKADGSLVTRTRHRVSLSQVDFNRHMNQSAYPAVAELARVTWLFRSTAWQRWEEQGVHPVVGRQEIVYRRELAPLQKFEVDTRATGMDGRLLKVEHVLLVGDRVHARVDTWLLFIGPDGVLSADDAEALCADLTSAPLEIEGWRVTPS